MYDELVHSFIFPHQQTWLFLLLGWFFLLSPKKKNNYACFSEKSKRTEVITILTSVVFTLNHCFGSHETIFYVLLESKWRAAIAYVFWKLQRLKVKAFVTFGLFLPKKQSEAENDHSPRVQFLNWVFYVRGIFSPCLLHKMKAIMHIQETFDISPSVLQGMEPILAARRVGRPKSWGKSGVFRKNKWGKMATAFPPLSLLPNPLLVKTTNQKHWKNSSANHCLKTLLIALRWTKILWSKLLFLFSVTLNNH